MVEQTLQGKSAFVVEDEAMVSIMIEDALKEMGCTIAGTAANLDNALGMAVSVTADFAVLDLNLDGKLAYAVVDRLLERSMPLIISTGYAGAALPDRFQALPVLGKPFRPQDLERAVVKALQSKE